MRQTIGEVERPGGGSSSARERDRLQQLRHWATLMIMYLDGHGGGARPEYTAEGALERLRDLVDEELGRMRTSRSGGKRP